MKISDERLAELIKRSWHGTMQELSSALTELQQLRKERSWRVIETEGVPQIDGDYQFTDGKKITVLKWRYTFTKQQGYTDKEVLNAHGVSRATCWRPLPMDSPEVEEADGK